jgi:hypothetical protein
MVDPMIDPLTKWARQQKRNAAIRDRQQTEEASTTVVLITTLVVLAILCLVFLIWPV